MFVHWNWTAAGSDHVAREGRKGRRRIERERGAISLSLAGHLFECSNCEITQMRLQIMIKQ